MADVKITDLSAVTELNGTDSFIVEQSSAGTKRTTYENLKTKIVNGDTYTALNGENIVTAINNKVPFSSEVGYAHNSIARGKSLGSSVTSAQWAAIKNGTFDNMYIGDYWTINDRRYYIAAFNYYFRPQVPFHVVIVPSAALSENVKMNDTASNASGYKGSTMFTTTIDEARTKIQNDFGAAHIWARSLVLSSAVTNGEITSANAQGETDITLMSRGNVFGDPTRLSIANLKNDNDQEQFPLFTFFPYTKRISGFSYWLRDPVSTDSYMLVEIGSGVIRNAVANTESAAIRPCFCIYSA